MVKFQKHLRASVVEEWKEHYVPFGRLKELAETSPAEFETAWKAAVESSSAFYQGEKLKLLARLRSSTDGFTQQVSDWVKGATPEETSAVLGGGGWQRRKLKRGRQKKGQHPPPILPGAKRNQTSARDQHPHLPRTLLCTRRSAH